MQLLLQSEFNQAGLPPRVPRSNIQPSPGVSRCLELWVPIASRKVCASG